MRKTQAKKIFETLVLTAVLTACSKETGTQSGTGSSDSSAKVALKEKIAKTIPKKHGTVFFKWPEKGSKIFSGQEFVFGVNGGLEVKPAGEAMENPNAGHHHIIIDGGPVDEGQTIPMDAQHLHFGKGETMAKLKLEPGPRTLTLQFADGEHKSYGPPRSQVIEVDVAPQPEKVGVGIAGMQIDGVNKVKSPLEIDFELFGFALRAAGEDPTDKRSGHYHVIIDSEPVPVGEVIPSDEKHKHFDQAEADGVLELAKGKHTLTLQLGDASHRSYGTELSQTYQLLVE